MKKTSRTFKRFAAITSASLLAACMVAPMASFAATEEPAASTTVDYEMKYPKLPDGSKISSVTAYKIFNGEFKDANTFNVTSWADENTLTNILSKLPTDSEVYTALDGIKGKTESYKDAAEIIASYKDTENLEIFAKAAAEALTGGVTATKLNGLGTTDTTDDTVTFNKSDLAVGYYVVVAETEDTDENESTTNYTSKSLGMLTVTGRDSNNVIGDGTGAKISLPEVEKKVKEKEKTVTGVPKNETVTENNQWNDVADYDIGDAVDFKIYGTLPSNIAKYDKYYYKFTDNLVNKFDKPTSLTITITNAGEGDTTSTYTASYADGSWTVVGAGGIKAEEINVVNNSSDNGFTVEFADIKGNQNADANTKVTIEYSAVLNATAEIGNPGQINTVDLTYSNNPNDSGEGAESPKGTTPKDEVIVYTYEIDVLKEFKKADGSDATVPTGDKFEAITFSLKPAAGGEKLEFVLKDGIYYPAAAYPSENATADLKLTSDNKIILRGLDDGEYILTEEVQPDGFNKADPKNITISATTANNQLWDGTPSKALTAFSGVSPEAGIVDATVINTQGTTLPGTGGIGTTVFYLGGGAMVAVAGIYLISKKRMKNTQE